MKPESQFLRITLDRADSHLDARETDRAQSLYLQIIAHVLVNLQEGQEATADQVNAYKPTIMPTISKKKEEPIYETLNLDQCYIISKTDTEVLYAYNRQGTLELHTAKIPRLAGGERT